MTGPNSNSNYKPLQSHIQLLQNMNTYTAKMAEQDLPYEQAFKSHLLVLDAHIALLKQVTNMAEKSKTSTDPHVAQLRILQAQAAELKESAAKAKRTLSDHLRECHINDNETSPPTPAPKLKLPLEDAAHSSPWNGFYTGLDGTTEQRPKSPQPQVALEGLPSDVTELEVKNFLRGYRVESIHIERLDTRTSRAVVAVPWPEDVRNIKERKHRQVLRGKKVLVRTKGFGEGSENSNNKRRISDGSTMPAEIQPKLKKQRRKSAENSKPTSRRSSSSRTNAEDAAPKDAMPDFEIEFEDISAEVAAKLSENEEFRRRAERLANGLRKRSRKSFESIEGDGEEKKKAKKKARQEVRLVKSKHVPDLEGSPRSAKRSRVLAIGA